MDIYIGIALFALFLLLDAVLYAFQSAIEGVNQTLLEEKIKNGDTKAAKLQKMISNPARLEHTINMIVFVTNIIAGGYILRVVGRTVSAGMSINSSWIGFVTGLVMILILIIFGVVIPQKCGKRSPDKIANANVRTVTAICIVNLPIVWLVSFVSDGILRLFGIKTDYDNENVTEEEIITMVNEGQEQGVLEASEAEMITNIFELADKNAGDIMTHRSTIIALNVDMTLEEVIQKHIDGKYSRFPVYDEDIDHIVGTLHIRDALIVYRNMNNRKKQIGKIKGLIRDAYFVPETMGIDDVLKKMQADKVHMGIVIDEYGQTAGIISMEDIIEEIVGNILDEYDDEEEIIEQTEDDTYLVDGLIELTELNKLIGAGIECEDFETLNGFLISILKKIPEEGSNEEIEAFGFCFKIIEVSGNVIRKVEITRISNENIPKEGETDNE